MIADDLRQINHARPAAFLRRNVSNIGQNCLSNAAHHPLAALGEVSSALACAGAPKRQSRPNVVSFSDYKRSTLTRTMTKDIDTLAGH